MRGAWAENLAKQELQNNGLEILIQNYRIRGGEIDLVAKEQNVLVFVEVKQRARNTHGTPGEFITPRKATLLRRAALHYLTHVMGTEDIVCRFDAVLVEGTENKHQLEWLKNIF